MVFAAGFAAMLALGWGGFPRVLVSSTRQPVDFDHRLHRDKASQKCADCHAVTAEGDFSGTPELAGCAGCHAEPMGTTKEEKALVAGWVKPGQEIPWRSYARQPMNVRFSHAVHLNLAKLTCERCHGAHGATTHLAAYHEDRISGYSSHPVSMTMSDCEDCHCRSGVETGCLGCHK